MQEHSTSLNAAFPQGLLRIHFCRVAGRYAQDDNLTRRPCKLFCLWPAVCYSMCQEFDFELCRNTQRQ